jgi:hypothetical protein
MAARKASRKANKVRISIEGQSGSGKTYGSLAIATGITTVEPGNILVFDTENRAEWKSDKFDFYVVELSEREKQTYIETGVPTERYIAAIDEAVSDGYKVLILDSLSDLWKYTGIQQSRMSGNGIANWGKAKEKYFFPVVRKIQQAPVHVITTVRTKMGTTIDEKGKGKSVGLDPSIEGEYRYFPDFIMSIIDREHNAEVVKSEDRKDGTSILPTGMFTITPQIGIGIITWINEGEDPAKQKFITAINSLATKYKELKGVDYELPTLDTLSKEELNELGKTLNNAVTDLMIPG